MRSTKIVAALFVLVLCPPSWADDWTEASSVRVMQAIPGRNGMGAGTVIAVDKDGYHVLTCCHVILAWGRAPRRMSDGQVWHDAPVGETKVKPVHGDWLPAEIVAYHKNVDLALLRVRARRAKVKASPLATGEKYDGTAVTKCGYPGEGQRHIQGSKCMGTRRGTWSYGLVTSTTAVSSVPSRSGDSGGGLFRDRDQALVGVVWGAAQLDGQWRLCAVPIEDIHTFLNGAGWRPVKNDKLEW